MPDLKSLPVLDKPVQVNCSIKPILSNQSNQSNLPGSSSAFSTNLPLVERVDGIYVGGDGRTRVHYRTEGERKVWLERRKKYDEDYRNRHRAKVRAAQQKYLDKHPDKRRETCHNSYLKIRDKHLVWSKVHYAANRETIITRQSKKQKENRVLRQECLPFMKMLGSPMPWNIQAGAIALGVRKYRGAFEALRPHLLNSHLYVAEEVIWAFGEQREKRAVKDLILFAETITDRFLLSNTIIALRKIGTTEALAAARSFVSHEDPRVRFSVNKPFKAVYPIDLDNASEFGRRKMFSDVVENWRQSVECDQTEIKTSGGPVDSRGNEIGIEAIIPDAPADWIAKVKETKQRMDARRRGFVEEVKKGHVLISEMMAGLERPHQEGYTDVIMSGKILTMDIFRKIKKQTNSLE